MTFRDLVEGKLPTVKHIQKQLKSLSFDMIQPEFFDVEKNNTDAGMGGYDYIQISFDADLAKSKKRYSDVKLALMSITTKYPKAKVDTEKGMIILELADNKVLKRYKELKKLSKVDLVKIYGRSNKINSIKSEPKDDVINAILFDEFREKEVIAAFADNK